MVRYAKFRFTEVKDVLGRPWLPTLEQPANCTRFVLAQVRGLHVTVILPVVRRRRRRSTALPSRSAASPRVSVEPFPGFLHPDVSRLRHLRSGVVRCLFADQFPDSLCAPSIFICFLNLHADRPCRDFRGASDGSPATASSARSAISSVTVQTCVQSISARTAGRFGSGAAWPPLVDFQCTQWTER